MGSDAPPPSTPCRLIAGQYAVAPDRPIPGAGGGTAGQVILGAAWVAPPASLQPALYEPPYSAMCLPCGRGEGSIADDVYSLGVALIALALGRTPLAGLEERAVLQQKLGLGSYE